MSTESPNWIWIDAESSQPNQYVQFRRDFKLRDVPAKVVLRVCIDTNFAAWVNGVFVGCGQFQDFPETPKYSEMDITAHLRSGDNCIAIQGYHCGVDHFAYLPGKAGLWFELLSEDQTLIASSGATRVRRDPGFLANKVSRITPQRGFTFHYDAAGDDGWQAPDYCCDGTWRASVELSDLPIPQARPVPMSDIKPLVSGQVVAQGILLREEKGNETIAELMQQDFLSSRRSWELFAGYPAVSTPARFPLTIRDENLCAKEGVYLVIDLGREECGHLSLDLSTTGSATIDVAVGEHLDDLRVRSHIGGRNFASRYVARKGNRTFVDYLSRQAGRYIQLHITAINGQLQVRSAGLLPAEYPVQARGAFSCDDELINQIWQTSRRTLHLCMHEHFEDCPAREQALYANDSRSQMLCNYYAFGDYAFARTSLDLLGRSVQQDGFQELCAPMRCPITIPGFTMTWFLAMNDYLMHSDDREFIRLWMPRMREMMSCYRSSLQDGLFPSPTGERYWHFYDWADGLDGTELSDCTKFGVVREQRFDAPLNLLLALALQCLANMAASIGDTEFAAELRGLLQLTRDAIHRHFWDPQRNCYLTYGLAGGVRHHAELTQSLAILAGAGSKEIHHSLRAMLMDSANGLVETTLSQSLYKFESLLLDPACGKYVRDKMVRDWSSMLFAGASSFWETLKGGWDFHHAGSLCHGWSAIPVYLLGAYGLGIRPRSPGFGEFAEQSLLPIANMRGSVPAAERGVLNSGKRSESP